jgi:hypothetical protein
MKNKTSGTTMVQLVAKNSRALNILEKVSVSIFMTGFFLLYFKQPYAYIILIIGSIMTSINYYLFSFKFFDPENYESTGTLNSIGFINFLYKLMYYAFAISALAMLGLVTELNNIIPMAFICGALLIVIIILSLITKVKERPIIYNSTFYIRNTICLLLLTYLIMIKYNIN